VLASTTAVDSRLDLRFTDPGCTILPLFPFLYNVGIWCREVTNAREEFAFFLSKEQC